jgi:copper chaperone CopZ
VIAYSKIFKEGKADCCNTEELKKSFSKQKRILKSITPIVFVLLAFPYFTAGLHGDNTGDQSGMKSEWVIEGMTCEGCAAGMEGALTATDGMNSCNVSYEKGIMICYTDKSKLSRNEISVLVNRNGFKAVVKAEKPPNGKG